jgi:hypothetical protein
MPGPGPTPSTPGGVKGTPVSQASHSTSEHTEARKDANWNARPAGGTTPYTLLTEFTSILATVSLISLAVPAHAQPAFQNETPGPASRDVIDVAPYAARGLGLGIGGPPPQLYVPKVAAAAPTITQCGATGSVDVNATNVSGKVTAGGATTTCVVTFNPAYQNFNHCIVQAEAASTTASELAYSYTLTGITFTASVLAQTVVDYFCNGF